MQLVSYTAVFLQQFTESQKITEYKMPAICIYAWLTYGVF